MSPTVDPTPNKPKVLYLAGAHRSGTTMLTSALGGYEGVFAAGELHEVWDNVTSGRPCGCGRPLERCPVWGPILEEVCRVCSVRPEDAVRWRARSARVWHTGRLLRRAAFARPDPASPEDRSAEARYADLMEGLYAVIARRTGSSVVVDSTKVPSGAALLIAMERLEPYVVHLVRDPRATAYSWSKRKVRHISGWEEGLMEAGPLNSGLRWLGYNLLTERVARHADGEWLRLRYEDVTARPREEVDALASWLRVETESGPFEGPDLVRLGGQHVIAGNPDRFDAGTTRVRPDDRWRGAMQKSDRWVVTAVSLPLMRRYGYRPTAA